jgi:hypothetical protein
MNDGPASMRSGRYATSAALRKKKKIKKTHHNMKKYKTHIVWAVIVIVALGIGVWYGSAIMGGSTAAHSASGASARSGYARTAGGGFISGQIISVTGNNMTVALADGNSEVVFYSSSTQVMKPTVVPTSDLSAGTIVVVGGTSNSDGSLTAQSIQIQPGTGFTGGSAAGNGQ